ncbi:hypothetical protein FHS18_002857 [Paenibacillus phyllosphaerae]|uniref:Uncharacterized protein n=1 Tax=Paenibacillus phyllosphaerae TaxID=274593 RepID=A0A7W5AXW2_9BACL|nr:CBO0543 family protein [Paenibacillus phyllosphaerae]MBB3110790.1 hypothetical protein [Paenibacillus phyllosphaerae]
MTDKNVLLEEIEKVHRQLTELRQEYWLQVDLFTPLWWLLLAVMILPWVVWWRFADKQRLSEIVFYGVTISFLIFLLDHIGYELNLWEYPHKLVRFIPEASPIDFGILPVMHMFVYQYCRSWRSFVIVNIVMAAFCAFIAEPISVWIDFYKMLNWEYIYSFPIYIVKAVFVKALLERIAGVKKRAGRKHADPSSP